VGGGGVCVCARACMRVLMDRKKKEVTFVKFLPIRSLCLHFGHPDWPTGLSQLNLTKFSCTLQ
jgi:hypothetical protein